MTGIIVGFIMVVISSLIGEVRVGMAESESDDLKELVAKKNEEIKKRNDILRELSDDTMVVLDDYSILVEILQEKFGNEEADRLFLEKKMEQTPKDLNEFLNELKRG